jgi:hypothetical protein
VSKQIFSKFQNFRSVLIYGSLNEILVVTPNMASFLGPILYFHDSDVQGRCWSYFTHT